MISMYPSRATLKLTKRASTVVASHPDMELWVEKIKEPWVVGHTAEIFWQALSCKTQTLLFAVSATRLVSLCLIWLDQTLKACLDMLRS